MCKYIFAIVPINPALGFSKYMPQMISKFIIGLTEFSPNNVAEKAVNR